MIRMVVEGKTGGVQQRASQNEDRIPDLDHKDMYVDAFRASIYARRDANAQTLSLSPGSG